MSAWVHFICSLGPGEADIITCVRNQLLSLFKVRLHQAQLTVQSVD